jgi:hypothetical protein
MAGEAFSRRHDCSPSGIPPACLASCFAPWYFNAAGSHARVHADSMRKLGLFARVAAKRYSLSRFMLPRNLAIAACVSRGRSI